jgi:hypothetical protein
VDDRHRTRRRSEFAIGQYHTDVARQTVDVRDAHDRFTDELEAFDDVLRDGGIVDQYCYPESAHRVLSRSVELPSK